MAPFMLLYGHYAYHCRANYKRGIGNTPTGCRTARMPRSGGSVNRACTGSAPRQHRTYERRLSIRRPTDYGYRISQRG